jgi:hypothetical protein
VPPTPAAEVLTVATIRKSSGRRLIQFLFNERQRIFTLRPVPPPTPECVAQIWHTLAKKDSCGPEIWTPPASMGLQYGHAVGTMESFIIKPK